MSTNVAVWNGHAVLSYSFSTNLGQTWTYCSTILREPFHLSYPYVFHHEGNAYMIPETNKGSSVRLYIAVRFPDRWTWARTLLDGDHYVDTVLFYLNERWWLFTYVDK